MPGALVAGAAVLGGAVIGSGATKNAANTAAGAADRAAEANLQNAREYRDMMRGYVDPLTPYAYAGADALASRLGVSVNPFRTATTPQPQPQPANGNTNYFRNTAANPFANVSGTSPVGTGGSGARPYGGNAGQMDMSSPNYFAQGGSQGGDVIDMARQPDGSYAAPSQAPGPDWQAYLDANPDVAQNARDRAAAEGIDPTTVAQQHWELYGQSEGRTMPQTAAQAASSPPVLTGPQGPDPLYGVPANLQTAPPDPAAPDYGTRSAPGDIASYGSAPALSDYFGVDKFRADPGYAWRVSEGLKSVNAASAARGKLRSGDTMKALQDRGNNLADQAYNNWFSQQASLYDRARAGYDSDRGYNTELWRYGTDRSDRLYDTDRVFNRASYDSDRAYGRNVFDTDRNFAANRWDTQTGNIFALTNLGTGAINTMGGVGSNYMTAANGANTARADATGNAAIASGNATANLFGDIASGIGTIYGNRSYNFGSGSGGGGTSPAVPFDRNAYRSWVGGSF